MKHRISLAAILSALALLFSLGGTAQAASIPIRQAHRAAERFWIGAPGAARVLWCSRERQGDVCALRDYFQTNDGVVHGRETKILWVSRSLHTGRVSVTFLWERMSLTINS